jgi:GDP/UDP-N,N'-diacetylbacillosamine 2-epimerase (hydrolysing)
MKRKICVVSGSRADYGLLRWVMQGIKDDPNLTLQVIVTGMHLSPTFGLTYKEIETDGFYIDYKIETLNSLDTPIDIAEAIAKGIAGCAKAFDKLKPDLIIVLGDRFEIFAAASAALVARIPIAHIHGGETTVGAFDEAIRHSISKMSLLHFVAAEEYRNRVIQIGENPNNVHLVGGLGVDAINKISLFPKRELEKQLGIQFLQRSLLVTFHPVTLEPETSENQMNELLSALSALRDVTLIFTLPNADTGGLRLIKIIEEFVLVNKNAFSFISLGHQLYLSCLKQVDGVIGNSSSGLTEVPSFKKGTINIGDRQKGRLQSASVINSEPIEENISNAINRLYSEEFQVSLQSVINPYGTGNASSRILEILRSDSLDLQVKKKFHDL